MIKKHYVEPRNQIIFIAKKGTARKITEIMKDREMSMSKLLIGAIDFYLARPYFLDFVHEVGGYIHGTGERIIVRIPDSKRDKLKEELDKRNKTVSLFLRYVSNEIARGYLDVEINYVFK